MTDPNRHVVQRRLEGLGFEVEPIDEHESERRPDLLAFADQRKLYVEVKTRTEDAGLRSLMGSVSAGQTSAVFADLDKHNSISADIKHAQSQLEAVAEPEDFRLLWFRADTGLFVHGALGQIGATLYGIRMVTEGDECAQLPCACVYAGHADFYRFPGIDGAIVEVDQSITLLLNPFSPRQRAFAKSRIRRHLGTSVFDVGEAEAAGTVCTVAGDAPRGDDEALLRHLHDRYPGKTFHRFVKAGAGTVVTTIDARRTGGV